MNAVPKFADTGPISLFVSRSSCNAELATCRSSMVFALVVVVGWTTRVAAMARCSGRGMKTSVDVTVPDERILRRRFKAWLSRKQGNDSLVCCIQRAERQLLTELFFEVYSAVLA